MYQNKYLFIDIDKYSEIQFLILIFNPCRRYVILMKTHMLTYKENDGNWQSPTEIIPINNCCTVKSADDELNVMNSFVSPTNNHVFYDNILIFLFS